MNPCVGACTHRDAHLQEHEAKKEVEGKLAVYM
jgi:hypothetical protein